jgi:putative spermidine/putrescine transport system permease protein
MQGIRGTRVGTAHVRGSAPKRMPSSESVSRVYWALVLLPVAVLCVFYYYPLSKVLWLSVTVPKPGLGNFALLMTSEGVQRILVTTARICIVTSIVALVIGYVIAYAMVHASPQHRAWILFVVLLSFWLSVLIRAFAWLTLLQSRGVVNTALLQLGLISEPLPLTRNEFGVMLGMVHFMIPYAVLPLYANMQGIDQRLILAARGLGASSTKTFLRIFLPLTTPGIISAGILVFVFALGFYITPALLGGGKTIMLAEYISIQIIDALNWGTGAMLATTLLLIVVLMLATVSRFANVREIFGSK